MNRKRILVLATALLAMSAASSAWAQQYARPVSTNAANGWTAFGVGTLHQALDETTANGATDYIDSGIGNISTASLGLGAVNDPGSYTNNHILRAQCQATGGAKGDEFCIVALYDNGTNTLIATLTTLATRGVFATPPGELLIADASTITNYDNLRVEITANINSSGKDNESVQVSWVELEVPAPSTIAPAVTTIAATGRDQSSATLGGNVSSDGGDSLTGVGVYYSTTSGFTPPAQGTQLPMTIQPVPGNFTGDLTSLPAGTTYYYRAYATNTVDEAIAANQEQFTTKDFPTMSATPTVTIDSPTSATLGGTMTSNGFDPTGVSDCGIEWGTLPGGPYTQVSAGVCTENNAFTAPQLVGLTTGQDYYFRSYATNSVGTAYSNERQFRPVDTPTVTGTVDEPSTTDTTAVLGGDITATGGDTVTAVGIIWDTDNNPVDGGLDVPMTVADPFSQTVTGLPAGTNLWFVAYASNGAGPGYSAAVPFTTDPGAPTMDPTPTITGVDIDRATLGGTMISDGGGTVSCGVEWSETTGAPYESSQTTACTATVPFSTEVLGLTTGTTYYFRAFATSAQGTDYSDELSFVPQGPPVVTASVANILLESAELQGNVTNDGGSNIIERGFYWNTVSPATAGTQEILGSGPGTYSRVLTGLAVGERIYYEAYATNTVQTGYSGEQFFDTLSEPSVQASNVTFPAESGGSMRISWTRGNGSGVIVVFRLSTTGRADPADDADFLANADFSLPPPELPPNSNNFVVYKGTGTSVLVTKLAENTAYSVVVYEYGDASTGPDYMLADAPLATNTGTHSTTDVPVHNMDFAVNCDNCHKHGSFGTNGAADLIISCQICHSDGQAAELKQEYSNHLAPNRNPGVDYVDCGVCHELHNPGGENTTLSYNPLTDQTTYNKSFLRANVNKYIPGAVNGAFLHNDQPRRDDPHPDAPPGGTLDASTPERAVEGGNATTARGYCQTCHTMTNYHRNNAASDTPAVGASGLMQCHDGDQNNTCAAEVHCGDCHQHNDTFKGVGGSTTCMVCHASGTSSGTLPRREIMSEFDYPATAASTHIYATNDQIVEADCLVCHDFDTHQQQYVTVWNKNDNTTTYAQTNPEDSALIPSEGAPLSDHCLSCHDDGVPSTPFTGSSAAPILNAGDTSLWTNAGHNAAPTVGCVGCHVGHGSSELALLNPNAPAFPALADPSDFDTNFCIDCHDADGPSTKNIAAKFEYATETVTGVNRDFEALMNNRHDVRLDDKTYSGANIACKDCHLPHVDNAANPVRNPDDGSLIPPYSITSSFNGTPYASGTNLDPLNPAGKPGNGYVEPDNIAFCLVCHDGTLPAGSGASMGAAPTVNMEALYFTDRNHDVHGIADGNGAGQGYLKYPWTPNGATSDITDGYAAMNCTTCHDAHGSGNIFNLRTSITVAGEVMTTGGWAGDTIGQTQVTEYFLPNNGTEGQDMYYWGAWCSFCHQMESHNRSETAACNTGHKHGGGNF